MSTGPQLQIDRKVEDLEARCKRLELAVNTLCHTLAQTGLGFSEHDSQTIQRLINDEKTGVRL